MERGLRNELTGVCALAAATAFLGRKPKLGLAFSALAGSIYFLNQKPRQSFSGQSVVITGGSRGLGLALALRFARENAHVTILARDSEELGNAARMILEQVPHTRLLAITCDVTDSKALENALRKAAHDQGGVDLLLNNAGAILVGPFEAMERADFQAQMELHPFAVVEACKQALPYLRKSRGRRIVNICSMGGKVGVPHMLPYDASKFALSGFSQGLRAELASEGISVTTVYPALMRTGSPIQAVFKGDHEKEYAWFAAADVLPGLSAPADQAAEKILDAARWRDAELIFPAPAKVRMAFGAFLPETFLGLMGLLARTLPLGKSKERRTGAQSSELFEKLRLTAPFRHRAHEMEKQWNQKPKDDAGFNLGLKAGGSS